MENDYSSLSDQELSQMLKDYGVSVGPINMATRKVYEMKLHKLKTGQAPAAAPKYAPVANDEDDQDDEVQFKSPSIVRPPPTKPAASVITPEPSQPRQRREPTHSYTPLIDSRPSLGSARKTTLSYDARSPDPPAYKAKSPPAKSQVNSERGGQGGLPMWVKLSALLVAAVLVYLIYVNMESNTASNIPKIPGKMEV